MEEKQKLTIVTVLPLIGLSLQPKEVPERLLNGYAILSRDSLPVLNEFDETKFREQFGIDLNEALWAEHYLEVKNEYAFPPESGTLRDTGEKGTQQNAEKIDRFLLALNVIERLWSFRPDVRLSWFEGDYPAKWKLVTYRHHYPISTFEEKPDLGDFRSAAVVTSQIDRIYTESERKNLFPAVRTALDALRSGTFAIHIGIRFLQEAIALETLCSTDVTEVTHRVAVGCAIMLNQDFEERQRMYDQVKRLYGKRSSIIHGSARKLRIEELNEIEHLSRVLVRRIMEGDILPHYESRSSQKEFLLRLQLGERP